MIPMTKDERIAQLEEQVATQERQILILRAEKAEALKRASDLQRLYDRAQSYIDRIKPDPKAQANAYFRGQG